MCLTCVEGYTSTVTSEGRKCVEDPLPEPEPQPEPEPKSEEPAKPINKGLVIGLVALGVLFFVFCVWSMAAKANA